MKDALNQLLKDLPRAPELAWRDVETNTRRLVEWAVERGKLSADDARQVLANFADAPMAVAQSLEEALDRFIKAHITDLHLPRKDELSALRQRVNHLIDRVDQLEVLARARRARRESTRD